MAFEDPDITVTKWEATPQYRLRLLLKEGFHHSLGNVGRLLPDIIRAAKGVHDPDLAKTVEFLHRYHQFTNQFLTHMPQLIRYAEEQAKLCSPYTNAPDKSVDGREVKTEVKECAECGSIYEGHRLSKYCGPECREASDERTKANAKARVAKKKGK